MCREKSQDLLYSHSDNLTLVSAAINKKITIHTTESNLHRD